MVAQSAAKVATLLRAGSRSKVGVKNMKGVKRVRRHVTIVYSEGHIPKLVGLPGFKSEECVTGGLRSRMKTSSVFQPLLYMV